MHPDDSNSEPENDSKSDGKPANSIHDQSELNSSEPNPAGKMDADPNAVPPKSSPPEQRPDNQELPPNEFDESLADSSADELPGIATSDESNENLATENEGGGLPKVHGKDHLNKERRIGPYKIRRLIGEGGMGTVYEADQVEPIRRRVALKLIKHEKESDQIIARFEAERQALAIMEHDNIAKVLDAGECNGSPYFAMELVSGISITEYCNLNKLSINERLDLFIPVCSAVQHAHQKGIIHRDLKPSNILVEERDGKAVPKVIDFGLAKALNVQAQLTEKSLVTEYGRIVGTVHYMSPEQAEMNQLDVDTRTDIYSLGVILYELLTGTRPLDDETIKQNVFFKILEMIRELEPPKPSSRLSSADDSAVEFSNQRKMTPGKLEQMLKGDLDWIVMKAIEKDRARRYTDANDFAEDVQRYLNGDPIKARPPSTTYRLSKFVKKNFATVLSVSVILILLVVGFAVTAGFAISLNKSNNRLTEERIKSDINAKREKVARADSDKNAKMAQQNAAQLKVKTDQLVSEKIRSQKNAKLAIDRLKQIETRTAKSLEKSGFGVIAGLVRKGQLTAGLKVEKTSTRRLWLGGISASANGKFFATGDFLTGSVRVWDSDTHALLNSINAHSEPENRGGFWPTVSGIIFHPSDPGILFSAGLDGALRKWQHSEQKLLTEMVLENGHQITAFGIDASSDPLSLVLSTEVGELIRLDADSLEVIDRKNVSSARISGLDVLPNGEVAIVGRENAVVICDAKLNVVGKSDFESPELLCVAVNTTGDRIVVGGVDGKVVVINASDRSELKPVQTFEAHDQGEGAADEQKRVRDIQWIDDNKFLTAGSDGIIKLWDSDTFEELGSMKGHRPNVFGRADVMSIAYLEQQNEMLSIGRDDSVRIWDVISGKETFALSGNVYPHSEGSLSDYIRADYSDANGLIVTACEARDAYVRLWDAGSLNEKTNYVLPPNDEFFEEWNVALLQDVAINPQGDQFVVAGPTGKISLWNVDDEKALKTTQAHKLELFRGNPRLPHIRLRWSADGKKIYSIGQDYKLMIFDAESFIKESEFLLDDEESNYDRLESNQTLPEEQISELREAQRRGNFDNQLFVLGSNQVVTGGRDQYVRYWDLETGKMLNRISSSGNKVSAMAISADESFLAVGTDLGIITVFEIETGTLSSSINLHFNSADQSIFGKLDAFSNRNWFADDVVEEWRQSIYGLAFSKSNRLLAATTGRGTLTLATTAGGSILSRGFAYDEFKGALPQLTPFFTNDNRLITVGADRTLRLWEMQHQSSETLSSTIQINGCEKLASQSNRIALAGAGNNGRVALWEKSKNSGWKVIELDSEISDTTSVCFIPDSQDILIGNRKGKVVRYDPIEEKVVLEFKGKTNDRVFEEVIGKYKDGTKVAVSWNGSLAASVWTNRRGRDVIEFWDLKTGKYISEFSARLGVEAICFHPSDQIFAFTDEVGTLTAIDLTLKDDPSEMFNVKGPQFATGLTFSNDGKRIVQTGEYFNNRSIAIWQTESGSEIDPVSGEPAPSIEITRNRRDLFNSNPVISIAGGKTAGVADVAFSPDGTWMVTADMDGSVVLWQVNEGRYDFYYKVGLADLSDYIGDDSKEARRLDRSMISARLTDIGFTSDGTELVVIGNQGPVKLIKISEIKRLASRSENEFRLDIREASGLELTSEGKIRPVEKNQLEKVN